jgi:hypothetical protein
MKHYLLLIGVMVSAFLFPAFAAYAQADLSGSTLAGNSGSSQQSAVGGSSPIDILVDSDSYVPPFYRGRALPSAGTNIRLQAIPYFKNADGSSVPTSDIIFTWKQDDRVIGNVSGLGKSSVVLPAALLYGTTNIEVDAESSDDTSFGTAVLSIPSVVPPLILYEDNPLLGITYYRALGSDTTITDTEMTFAVVPYFAQIQSPNDPQLSYVWTVNGSNILPDPKDPSEITLNSKDSSGAATIGLSLSQSDNIFMNPTASWDVTLGTAASNAFTDTGSGAKNPFSGQTQ